MVILHSVLSDTYCSIKRLCTKSLPIPQTVNQNRRILAAWKGSEDSFARRFSVATFSVILLWLNYFILSAVWVCVGAAWGVNKRTPLAEDRKLAQEDPNLKLIVNLKLEHFQVFLLWMSKEAVSSAQTGLTSVTFKL